MAIRRMKRVLLGLLLSIMLIGAAGVYIAWRLSWQRPTWYAPPDPTDARVSLLADDTEYTLLEQTQKVRAADQPWPLLLTSVQINAWLAARLPRWIENDASMRWPEQIGTPQVLIDTDGIRVAVPVSFRAAGESSDLAEHDARTLVATLKPAVAADGRLSLTLTSIALGRVWVPGAPLTRLADALRDAAPEFLDNPQVQQAMDVLAGRQMISPDFALADGRHVRVTDIRLTSGAIQITAMTQR